MERSSRIASISSRLGRRSTEGTLQTTGSKQERTATTTLTWKQSSRSGKELVKKRQMDKVEKPLPLPELNLKAATKVPVAGGHSKQQHGTGSLRRTLSTTARGRSSGGENENDCGLITTMWNNRLGLGNLMFMYASLFAIAKINKRTSVLTVLQKRPMNRGLPFAENVQISTPVWNEPLRNSTLVVEDRGKYNKYVDRFAKLSCDGSNVTLGGLLQSWKYFHNYSRAIKREFRFWPDTTEQCEAIVRNFSRNHTCLLVGAHTRRNDWATASALRRGRAPATSEYLHAAIDYYRKKFSNQSCLRFIIVGKDNYWNSLHAPNTSDVLILKPVSAQVDMCVLSRCNHNIQSIGTYGWWASYLAAGHITYQAFYAQPNSKRLHRFTPSDYFMPGWVPLGPAISAT